MEESPLARPARSLSWLSALFILFALTALVRGEEWVVAVDGTGKFPSIHEALDAVPKRAEASAGARWILRIKPGIYREKLVVRRDSAPVSFIGEDRTSTLISGTQHAGDASPSGGKLGTFESAGTTVLADDFIAENLTFQNSHGAGSQAVALRLAGDRAILRHCAMLGWQDTLLLQEGRHYLEDCHLVGSVDFIFGGATALFEHCTISCLANGFITAASTPEDQRYGFIFSGCSIHAEENAKVYLGRPWRPFGSVTFLSTSMSGNIESAGWHNWNDPSREQTARFAEYQSRGAGAGPEGRVAWSRQLAATELPRLWPAEGKKGVLSGRDDWDPRQIPSAIRDDAQEWGVDAKRIATLPEPARAEWQKYLAHSAELLKADQDALAMEMHSVGIQEALPAPAGEDFKLAAKESGWFGSDEAVQLAEIILTFQTPAGGWSKAISYQSGPRQPGMQWSSQATPTNWHYVGTIDNGATTAQIDLLARIFQATKRETFRDSALRGLRYLLAAQYPTGGWPQIYPVNGGYHDAITFNDDAMARVLDLLQRVAHGDAAFDFAAPLREEAARAVEAGVQCLLKSQYTQGGQKTAWCAQHDPLNLAPVAARRKEPASLSGGESIGILRFLMRRPQPGPGEKEAIEAGLSWFEASRLLGWRQVQRDGRNLWEQDPNATEPLWARFYDLQTNQPIFGGAQDGIIYDSFDAMARNNRFGYAFFTPKPKDLLNKDQVSWRKKLSK